MTRVNMTEFRRRLPYYLDLVAAGEPVEITRRGAVVACMTPAVDRREAAKAWLHELRKTAVVGDVEAPIDVEWDAAQ